MTSIPPDSYSSGEPDPVGRLLDTVEHLDHVLPGQAPLHDFVHHNTLHGFQHLPFRDALAAAERLTGNRSYQSDRDFRRFFAEGRILQEDLDAALDAAGGAGVDAPIARANGRDILRRDLYRIALVFGIDPIAPAELRWRVQEFKITDRFQEDLPETVRGRLLSMAKVDPSVGATSAERAYTRELWSACLGQLVADPSGKAAMSGARQPTQTNGNAVELASAPGQRTIEASEGLDDGFAGLGSTITLRAWVFGLTGVDALEQVRPAIVRFCGSHLDEGLAAWHAPGRGQGLYAAWRGLVDCAEGSPIMGRLGWPGAGEKFPEDPAEAVLAELARLGIAPNDWGVYLEKLALEIPGWSGMVNWRQRRKNYASNDQAPSSLLDYLALRLILDRHALEPICRETWGVAANIPALRTYFARNRPELLVRQCLFAGRLPESLAAEARHLTAATGGGGSRRADWRLLAEAVEAWWQTVPSDESGVSMWSRENAAWRLFRLAQHLGLGSGDLRSLSSADCAALLAVCDELDANRRGYLWLLAFERRYREELFNALTANRGRGHWAQRTARPEAQIVFCMDEREETIRRHLEELNPAIETLGAAGFFGVAMNWRGLDDDNVTALCPIVVVPSHEVREVPRPGLRDLKHRHDRRLRLMRLLQGLFTQELRRNLLSSHLLIDALSPAVLMGLIGQIFFPLRRAALAASLNGQLVPEVRTRVHVTAEREIPATPDNPRLGFTDLEQVDRIEALLRNMGLTTGLAPLVVVMGHGSTSQNNPHHAAHDCGACSGRHGGPNARVFAAIANRHEVRAGLAERGMAVPDDCWFVGAQHDTCSEELTWFDLDDLPIFQRARFAELRRQLEQACRHSAHERCRRLEPAAPPRALPMALARVARRAVELSQARPEFGHATNAAAIVGRRCVSQGLFLDRRVFLISYDPLLDPQGAVLEGLLLAVGPVGAGINLEYYFSSANPEKYGCGTKVPQNVVGLFGVMEGVAGDLRTGLPIQMTEIHEPMRLQLVIEQKIQVLLAIYERQPPLRELIGNGWINVAAMDPDTGAISEFQPGTGFVRWERPLRPLPEVAASAEWYAGASGPLGPALIRQRLDAGGVAQPAERSVA